MKIFSLILLSCLWIGSARADVRFSPRDFRKARNKAEKSEALDTVAEGAALAAAIAAAGLAVAKKKKKNEKTPEELVIDQDQPEESEDA